MVQKDNALEPLFCGGCAGLISRFFIAPLDVLKIRFQLQSETPLYTSILHGFRTIIKNEGITGLWKGNVPAELLYVTYSASQFWTYKRLMQFQQDHGSGTLKLIPVSAHAFIAGAGAGTVATAVTYPFDLFRTRFAAQGHVHVYPALRSAIASVIRDEGWRGMYRGLTASIIQIVPYMGLLFGTYEPCRKLLEGSAVPSGWESAIAGFIAGSASKTGVFPLDLIRKRLQVQGPTRKEYFLKDIPVYAGLSRTIRKIWQREGMRGFYKGLGISLLKSAPSSAITLWTYEQSSRLWKYVERNYGAN